MHSWSVSSASLPFFLVIVVFIAVRGSSCLSSLSFPNTWSFFLHLWRAPLQPVHPIYRKKGDPPLTVTPLSWPLFFHVQTREVIPLEGLSMPQIGVLCTAHSPRDSWQFLGTPLQPDSGPVLLLSIFFPLWGIVDILVRGIPGA